MRVIEEAEVACDVADTLWRGGNLLERFGQPQIHCVPMNRLAGTFLEYSGQVKRRTVQSARKISQKQRLMEMACQLDQRILCQNRMASGACRGSSPCDAWRRVRRPQG